MSASTPPEASSLESLTAAAFRDAASTFTLRVPSGDEEHVVELELDHVDGLAGDTPRKDGEPFSVVFRSREGHTLPQAIYRLDNETMGPLDLFIVCLGPDPKGEGSLFEAVFT